MDYQDHFVLVPIVIPKPTDQLSIDVDLKFNLTYRTPMYCVVLNFLTPWVLIGTITI